MLTTKSQKYQYETVQNQNAKGSWDKFHFNVYNLNGKLVYQRNLNNVEETQIALMGFEMSEDGQVAAWLKNNKQVAKLEKEKVIGNYAQTKKGKELAEKARLIQAQNNLVKSFKIEKSDMSSSVYIILETEENSYTIRISDHVRPVYFQNGATYEHQYFIDVVLKGKDVVNWEFVIKKAVEEIC